MKALSRHPLVRVVPLLLLPHLLPLTGGASRFLLLAYPVVINVCLAVAFGRTLLTSPSFVERVARSMHGTLSPEKVRYCWRVTAVWFVFFCVNGALSLLLAIAGYHTLWSWYTGAVSYLLIGVLFAGEFLYRQIRFRPVPSPHRAADPLRATRGVQLLSSSELQESMEISCRM